MRTLQDAISAAEAILPGRAAPEGEKDPRWQAIVAVGEFIQSEPEAVWFFILRWGGSPDKDLRMAIATCLLEHLLEHHFDAYISRVEEAAYADRLFAKTVSSCWNFGEAKEASRASRWDGLRATIRERSR